MRLEEKLDLWVRRLALEHTDGQSGVLNDAVAFYRDHLEKKSEQLFDTIVGEAEHG